MLQRIGKWMTAAAAAALLIALIPAAVSAAEIGGDCGSGVIWSLSDGTLTISGSGNMDNFGTEESQPWYEYQDSITEVVVQSGVTRVGSAAFAGCEMLIRATLADTVTAIGNFAFMDCTSLQYLTLSSGLISIGDDAFRMCTSLNAVRLPDSLTSLGSGVFYRCYHLTAVTIPASVTRMGSQVFSYCDSLIYVVIDAPLEQLPAWTFYGCSALGTLVLSEQIQSAGDQAFYGCECLENLYCSTEQSAAEALTEAAQEGNSNFSGENVGSTDERPASGSSTQVWEEDGSVVICVTDAAQTEDATITTVYAYVADGSALSVTLSAVVEDSTGLEAVLAEAEGAAAVYSAYEGGESSSFVVTVAMKGEAVISDSLLTQLEALADTLTVTTSIGVVWILSGESSGGSTDADYDFSVSLTLAEEPPKGVRTAVGESAVCYRVVFSADCDYKVQVTLSLPASAAGGAAALYSVSWLGQTELLQAVYADNSGNVTYYLDGIDTGCSYYIAIDPEGLDSDSVLITGADADSYGGSLEYLDSQVQYVVTGSSSSWGIELWQMTAIIAAVLVVSLGAVGAVMFSLNKRKLKKGYVPDIPS